MSQGASHSRPVHLWHVVLVVVLGLGLGACGEPPEQETEEVVKAMEEELRQLRLEVSALQEENARLNEQQLLGQQNLGAWKQLERVGTVKGMSPFSRFCPAEMALVGFNGQAGAVIDALIPVCSPLYVEKEPGPRPIQIELPPAGPSAGGDHFERRCKAGDHVVAIRGQAGENVSSIEVLCGRYREKAAQYPLPVVGGTGGDTYYRRCPKGYALSGISGRADEYISSLVPLCAPLSVKSVHTNGGGRALPDLRPPKHRRSLHQPMERAVVPSDRAGKADADAEAKQNEAQVATPDGSNAGSGTSADEDPGDVKENKKELSPR